MVLKLEDKKSIVSQLAQIAASAHSVLVVDYRGLTVAEMTELRVAARKVGVFLKVVRNTLARRALKGTAFECLGDSLVGPVLLSFGGEELAAPARLFVEFLKTNEKITVKALSLGDQLLEGGQLERVASLPTKAEALAKLLFVMKAPITQLVRTVVEPYAKLVRALAAVRDQKQSCVK